MFLPTPPLDSYIAFNSHLFGRGSNTADRSRRANIILGMLKYERYRCWNRVNESSSNCFHLVDI